MTRAALVAALVALAACSGEGDDSAQCLDYIQRMGREDARLARDVESLRWEIRRGIAREAKE